MHPFLRKAKRQGSSRFVPKLLQDTKREGPYIFNVFFTNFNPSTNASISTFSL